jgi:aerobic-type carbon monoxide dehydrogenase small subunit (CoxS/CutS family)
LTVNDRAYEVDADPDTPLLYVLADDLRLKGPRFGFGLAQCGSCSVLLDGKEIRSCVTPVSAVQNGAVTTLEGLPQFYAGKKGLAAAARRLPMLSTTRPACNSPNIR